ncbi:MAG: helix-turn-helix transcriptional regulator [Micrococcales bacterium]|nr:helix-turn-helix transcriptional regulator [Micrococcales bacterium]MCL2667579.1 helix-turn-helix transcriptional regulator [Micrococcales bacterium]
MLDTLADLGMAWRDVARLTGVSVPAVQKWRQGGDLRGESRLRLARVVALLDALGTYFISDAVSWLEMPVMAGVALSRMDLFASGRTDLLLILASDDETTAPTTVLDEYEPTWRFTLVDDNWEAFQAADGHTSVRPTR